MRIVSACLLVGLMRLTSAFILPVPMAAARRTHGVPAAEKKSDAPEYPNAPYVEDGKLVVDVADLGVEMDDVRM